MRCVKASELMSLHLDGMLTEEEIGALNRHLALCRACREEWQALQSVHVLLSKAELAVPTPGLRRRIMAQIPARCSYTWFSRLCIVGVVGVLILSGLGLLPILRILEAVYRDPTVMAAFIREFLDLLRAGGVLLEAMEVVLHSILSRPGDLVMAMGYLGFGLLVIVVWKHFALESFHLSE